MIFSSIVIQGNHYVALLKINITEHYCIVILPRCSIDVNKRNDVIESKVT